MMGGSEEDAAVYDVITLGEAMVRLAAPGFGRLEQATSLEMRPGGAELNVAVACARLGMKTAWVSRLPDQPLGRFIRNKAREQGVDTEAIVWGGAAERVGVYYVEFGAAPRSSSVVYDRADAAVTRLAPGEVDWAALFAGSRHFHTSGITPALSPSLADVTREALEAAKEAGLTTSYDLNYRGKLWSPEEARRVQEPLMPLVDVLITTEEDTQVVFGISADGPTDANYEQVEASSYAQVAAQLGERFGHDIVAITLRSGASVWFNGWSSLAWQAGKFYTDTVRDLEIVDRFGGGDSFAGGFIYGLQHYDVGEALRFANAFSALKHSVPSDFAWVTRAEVEAVLRGDALRVKR
ncbi:MAG TPA: sugar kinase [Armatimonadetes bacterium]|nr:sugar kinase [Armatimonadota bacterium]